MSHKKLIKTKGSKKGAITDKAFGGFYLCIYLFVFMLIHLQLLQNDALR